MTKFPASFFSFFLLHLILTTGFNSGDTKESKSSSIFFNIIDLLHLSGLWIFKFIFNSFDAQLPFLFEMHQFKFLFPLGKLFLLITFYFAFVFELISYEK